MPWGNWFLPPALIPWPGPGPVDPTSQHAAAGAVQLPLPERPSIDGNPIDIANDPYIAKRNVTARSESR